MKMEYLSMEVEHRKRSRRSDVMNNEWLRFESYTSFPADSVVRPLRLARAGFYYTGFEEEVECFCCGVKNGVWTEDETVLDVHRRLSPNCKYISGETTANIAISGDNRLEVVPNSSKDCDFSTEHWKSMTESQLKHTKFDKTRSGCYNPCTQTAEHSTEEYEEERNVYKSGIQTQHASLETAKESHKSRSQKYDMGERASSSPTNGQIEIYPGVYHSRPKHTDYSMLKDRLASFEHCSEQLAMDPTVLAKAGFYSAGSLDCVRCFFCGIGMKNWQYGDNPWIEHARWTHDCAYLELCKGELFINTIRAAINADHDKESKLDQENIPEDWLIENINSAAAKIILSMGYKQEDVEKGVLFARQKYGATEIRAQHIMEYMQETNKQSSTKQPSATGQRQTEQRCSEEESHKSSITARTVQKNTNSSKHKSEKQRLREENRELKDLMTCKICFDNDACVAFLPCGHLASCVECSKSLKKCAICRTDVQATVRVYQA